MKIRLIRPASVAGLMLLGSLALSGCTFNVGTAPDSNQSQSESAFSANDLMFAQMMIPHHQQAIEMSQLAASRTENAEVLRLADQIEAAQAPEIEQMRTWLGGDDDGMMSHDMGSHGMDGMVSDEDMIALENARGAEFDRLFLESMIAHHEGAIQMTSMISSSKNPAAQALADSIVSSQTEEIASMKTLLSSK